MVKIGFYVPQSHLESVKRALFDAGAGRVGDYDECCWQCLGRGEFRPNEQSNPTLGQRGEKAYVDEYRVEMVCEDSSWREAVKSLIEAHPYEEPAYDVISLLDPYIS